MVFEDHPLLSQYVDLLHDWNGRIRLTGFQSTEDIRKNLVLEPVNAFRHFSLSEGIHPLVDLGSGNGSPGIIFAILNPGRPLILIERRQKKMTFLLYAAGKLSLSNVQVFSDVCEIPGTYSSGPLEIWSKAVSWEDLAIACAPLYPLYQSVCIRKFGSAPPPFACSSSMVHGITVQDFSSSGDFFEHSLFYVSEAVLKGSPGYR